ncbi:MAG: hypothetical protein H0W30_18910 [Gemmatimonadaceae bacterium]|nr:hypothetical protein [Gemmatimonadaceae bacterium]MBA3560656.1 hypothetical protein [Gemmatimonadaceae bacterium]
MSSNTPEEEAEAQRLFTRDVVERLIAKGLHPARAEAAVEKGLRFLQLNTGAFVARVIADHGPIETWQDGAASVLLRDINYYAPAPIEQPKAANETAINEKPPLRNRT